MLRDMTRQQFSDFCRVRKQPGRFIKSVAAGLGRALELPIIQGLTKVPETKSQSGL
jgi:hypothetical protein